MLIRAKAVRNLGSGIRASPTIRTASTTTATEDTVYILSYVVKLHKNSLWNRALRIGEWLLWSTNGELKHIDLRKYDLSAIAELKLVGYGTYRGQYQRPCRADLSLVVQWRYHYGS